MTALFRFKSLLAHNPLLSISLHFPTSPSSNCPLLKSHSLPTHPQLPTTPPLTSSPFPVIPLPSFHLLNLPSHNPPHHTSPPFQYFSLLYFRSIRPPPSPSLFLLLIFSLPHPSSTFLLPPFAYFPSLCIIRLPLVYPPISDSPSPTFPLLTSLN